MGRAGLYQSDIKKARDALLAQGRYPSVDAVRVALGNTGSKTTIHKYLKELETEEGSGDGRKAPISDALHDIVVRLAARLHEEADERTSAIESLNAEQERDHAAAVNNYEKELAELQQQLRQARDDGVEEIRTHTQTRSSLQNEIILRHTAQQQVADLQERLAENEAHRRSLEESMPKRATPWSTIVSQSRNSAIRTSGAMNSRHSNCKQSYGDSNKRWCSNRKKRLD